MPEAAELDNVSTEEQRDCPVGDDAQLPREERQLLEVVPAGGEPAGESAEEEAQHVRHPAVAAERRHLAEHPVAVRLRRPGEISGEPARLAEGVLAGRRVRPPGRRDSARAPSPSAQTRSCPSTWSCSSTLTGPARRPAGRRREQRLRADPVVQTTVLWGCAPVGEHGGSGSTAPASCSCGSRHRAAGAARRRSREAGRDLRRIRSLASTSTQRCAARGAGNGAARRERGRRARRAPRRPRSRRRRRRSRAAVRLSGAATAASSRRGRGCGARSRRGGP